MNVMQTRVTDLQHAQTVPEPTNVSVMLVSLEMELIVLVCTAFILLY